MRTKKKAIFHPNQLEFNSVSFINSNCTIQTLCLHSKKKKQQQPTKILIAEQKLLMIIRINVHQKQSKK